MSGSWVNREADTPGAPVPFSVHEQDRAVIRSAGERAYNCRTIFCSVRLTVSVLIPRDNIVEAVVLAPDIIRIQLGVCVSQIVKHDFPERWPQARHCL